MCQGFSHFCIIFVLVKLATSSIRVNIYLAVVLSVFSGPYSLGLEEEIGLEDTVAETVDGPTY